MTYLITSSYIIIRFFIVYCLIEAVIIARNYVKKRRTNISKELLRFAFIAYLVYLLCTTIFPIFIPAMDPQPVQFNISPIYLLGLLESKYMLINVVGNMILFAPVVILGILNGYKLFEKLRNVIVFSTVFSAIIELIQLAENTFGYAAEPMYCDINDVILNVLGGIIGWACIYYHRKYYIKRDTKTYKSPVDRETLVEKVILEDLGGKEVDIQQYCKENFNPVHYGFLKENILSVNMETSKEGKVKEECIKLYVFQRTEKTEVFYEEMPSVYLGNNAESEEPEELYLIYDSFSGYMESNSNKLYLHMSLVKGIAEEDLIEKPHLLKSYVFEVRSYLGYSDYL